MALKNYASNSPMPSIFAAIEKTLTEHGAKQIVKEYDQGRIVSIAFVVSTSKGQSIAIKLPARFDRVEQIFKDQGVRYKEDQPYRTAWATIRDWIGSQMALIDWEMVKMEEVFLPYAVNRNGETFFETMERNQFELPSGEGDIIHD